MNETDAKNKDSLTQGVSILGAYGLKDPKSILVASLGGWSDSVLSSFVAPALKERFPGCQVTLLLPESLFDWGISLACDDIIWVNTQALDQAKWKQAAEVSKLLMHLRLKGFDLALNLQPSWSTGTLLKLGGIKTVLGVSVAPEDREKWFWKKSPYDQTILMDLDRHHEMDDYLALLAAIDVRPSKLNFKLRVRQDVHADIMKRLAYEGLRSKGYVVVAPGMGLHNFKHKRWTYFAEFLNLFFEKSTLPIVLLGADEDVELSVPLLNMNPKRVHCWVGQTTREEALAVVAESAGVIGCDSGLSHVAGAAGVPTVALFGPSSSKRRYPPGLGKNVAVLDAQVPCAPCGKDNTHFDFNCRDNVCMKSISPKDVWDAFIKVSDTP